LSGPLRGSWRRWTCPLRAAETNAMGIGGSCSYLLRLELESVSGDLGCRDWWGRIPDQVDREGGLADRDRLCYDPSRDCYRDSDSVSSRFLDEGGRALMGSSNRG
jgi:hypothetical protein